MRTIMMDPVYGTQLKNIHLSMNGITKRGRGDVDVVIDGQHEWNY